ncbi:MAG: hypothetical protein M1550_00655 [Deltaproteobacteria bacterium]|nr:hypothetical protein [Deltaproteobacteria bacterium]
MKIPGNVYFHPMFVHFPQALFPVAFALFALYVATGNRDLERAAALVVAAGALAAPVTTITGFLDWKLRYKAFMTSVFKVKITGAFVLIALSASTALLRATVPDVAALPFSGLGWVYAGLLTACLADCVVLGYYGGKLVFH